MKPLNILVLCTGNSARSILGEALLNHLGEGRVRAYSAGSHPAGRVNPLALEVLAESGVPAAGARSKSWDEFSGAQAPVMDVVITVCDSAAGETCPLWPGQPVRVHWGLPDPASVQGTDEEKRAAFRKTFGSLRARVQKLVEVLKRNPDRSELEAQLKYIHETHD